MQQATGIINPLNLDIEWRTGIESLDMHTQHAAPEQDKVDALAADMKQHGWVGAPIVTWGDRAYTGTHRIAAWNQATDGDRLPVIELADLLDSAGLDLDDYDELTEFGEEYVVARAFADLPTATRENYGLDLEP